MFLVSLVVNAGELTVEDLEHEFPGWHVWLGVSSLWYARRMRSSPPVILGAANLAELRTVIRDRLRPAQPADPSAVRPITGRAS